MGIGSRIRKGIRTGAKSLGLSNGTDFFKHALTGGMSTVDKAIGQVTGGTNFTSVYQDIEGHTAKAKDDVRLAGVVAANKALSEGNADVDRTVADVVLGDSASSEGESLTNLRKRRGLSTASQVGIV